MYLGRYQIGDWLDLQVQTKNADDELALPDNEPPTAEFWRSTDGAKIKLLSLPLANLATYTFGGDVFLSSTFTVSNYTVLVRWKVSGYDAVQVFNFEVVSGGSANGSVFGLRGWKRPEANFVVAATDGGDLLQGRNPSTLNSDQPV